MQTTKLSYVRHVGYMLLLVFVLLGGIPLHAQNDGQFCVRAYDDRNANGVRDASEPALQSGISAELTEENGVIIASALLTDSPTASQGIICFQGLSSGQYSIIVTTADFVATTPNTMTVAIQSGDFPSVLEFGARDVTATQTTEDVTDEVVQNPQQALERILVALLGAIVATLVMLVLGIIIFLLFFRGRGQQESTLVAPPPTDEMFRPPVSSDTGQYTPPQE